MQILEVINSKVVMKVDNEWTLCWYLKCEGMQTTPRERLEERKIPKEIYAEIEGVQCS